jgi:hypothetical protein
MLPRNASVRLIVFAAMLVVSALGCSGKSTAEGPEDYALSVESLSDFDRLTARITRLEVVGDSADLVGAIPQNTRITELWIVGNGCDDAVLDAAIGRLPNLRHIELWDNSNVTGKLPALKGLSGLEALQVTGVRSFDPAFWSIVAESASLRELTVGGGGVSEENAATLSKSKSLQVLSWGPRGGASVEHLRALAAGLPALEFLRLPRLAAPMPEALEALQSKHGSLKALSLQVGKSATELDGVLKFVALHSLEIHCDGAVKPALFEMLANHGALRSLTVGMDTSADLATLLAAAPRLETVEFLSLSPAAISGGMSALPPERALRHLILTFTGDVAPADVLRLAGLVEKGVLELYGAEIEAATRREIAERYPEVELR